MTKNSVAAVISYCTNDYRFIGKCIEEAKKFSSQIVIPVCDHFFDGTPENRDLLEWTYAEHRDCRFIEFPYLPGRLYSRYHALRPDDKDWSIYWAATARYIGFQYLDPEIEWVLFLDSDEVVEGEEFAAWFGRGELLGFEAVRLASYLYAVQPTLRMKKAVNLPLFVKKKTLGPLTLINPLERIGAYQSHPGPKREEIVGSSGRPFVHHYSWVRTKEECYKKTQTWGHRHDENWPALIEEAFQGSSKHYFGAPHEFEEIGDPFFDPFSVQIPRGLPRKRVPVLKIDEKTLFEKEIYGLL